MTIDQIGILLLGATAMALVNNHRPKVRRWGPVVGLLGQPFWYYASYTHGQWGIFASSFLYTLAWIGGFYNMWLRRT